MVVCEGVKPKLKLKLSTGADGFALDDLETRVTVGALVGENRCQRKSSNAQMPELDLTLVLRTANASSNDNDEEAYAVKLTRVNCA